jgi:hypothetical protein
MVAPSDVETQALQLDHETRARLALRLIQSLDSDETLTVEEVEQLWLREAQARLHNMESGEDPGIEASSAIREARKRLRQ